VSNFFQYGGCEQRKHDLVVAGEMKAFAPGEGRSFDYVGQGTIVGDKIHIYGGEIFYPVAQVPRQGQGFQENLG
jgi:hypothetical protein